MCRARHSSPTPRPATARPRARLGAVNAGRTKPGVKQVAFQPTTGDTRKYCRSCGAGVAHEFQKIGASPVGSRTPSPRSSRPHQSETLLEELPRRLWPLRRPRARVEGRRLQGRRRQLLGSAVVAAQAPRLRAACEHRHRRSRAAPLPLDGRAPGADGEHRLVVAPVEPPLRNLHVQRRPRVRAGLHLQRAAARLLRPEPVPSTR